MQLEEESLLRIIEKSKYFDESWYKEEYTIVADNWKYGMARHYLEFGANENRNPSSYFDTARYREQNCAGKFKNWNPLLHYELIGKKKGIIPPKTDYQIIKESKYFKPNWYRKYGLNLSPSNMVRHYLRYGWRDGLNPSSKFDGRKYLEEFIDVSKADVCPLVHYERSGKFEGRKPIPIKTIQYSEKSKPMLLLQKGCLKLFSYVNAEQIKQMKILVCLHIFYYKAWKEIKFYLDNLKLYRYDLIVTLCSENPESEALAASIKEYKSDVRILRCPNKGFDVGPFIESIKGVELTSYDVIIKAHSKGICRTEKYLYGKCFYGKTWFDLLYRGILGVINTHVAIRMLWKYPWIGMVATRGLIVEDPIFKKNLTNKWLVNNGYSPKENYFFVAGTCFMVRSGIIQSVKNIGLSIDEFETSSRGEFSLAHAVERLLSISVIEDNYHIKGNIVLSARYTYGVIKAKYMKRYSPLRLLDDKRFLIDDDFFFRVLEGQKIKSYTVEKIELSKIRRVWQGQTFCLEECAPYKYLLGNKTDYEEYCMYHKTNNLPQMSEERFGKLIESIENKGFDNKHLIVVNQNYVVLDGQHRACYLLYKYGAAFETDVLKVHLLK